MFRTEVRFLGLKSPVCGGRHFRRRRSWRRSHDVAARPANGAAFVEHLDSHSWRREGAMALFVEAGDRPDRRARVALFICCIPRNPRASAAIARETRPDADAGRRTRHTSHPRRESGSRGRGIGKPPRTESFGGSFFCLREEIVTGAAAWPRRLGGVARGDAAAEQPTVWPTVWRGPSRTAAWPCRFAPCYQVLISGPGYIGPWAGLGRLQVR